MRYNRFRGRNNTAAVRAANAAEQEIAVVVDAVRAAHIANGMSPSVAYGEIDEEHPEVDRVLRWSSATATLMARVLSVVGGTTVDVEWTGMSTLACTDGETVMFGNDWFLKHVAPAIVNNNALSTATTLGEFKAFGYHELCHILWTPRQHQRPTKDIQPQMRHEYNILEDQRIESMFVARYRPAVPLFTHVVTKFIAKELGKQSWADTTNESNVHILMHGRKYLPQSLRDMAYNAFATSNGTDLADKVSDIIDEYRTLVFPSDADRAVELVEMLHVLMQTIPAPANPSDGHGGHRKGRSSSPQEQREVQAEREEDDEKKTTEGQPNPGGKDGEPETSAESEEGNGEGNSEGETSGSGSPKGESDLRKELEKAANQTQADIDRDGRESVKSVGKMLDSASLDRVPTICDTYGASEHPLQPWMRVASKSISETIAKIFSDSEEAWHNGQSSGRLNVRDAMNARGTHFDVFDVWQDANEDGLSFEVVILLDRSSSMSSPSIFGRSHLEEVEKPSPSISDLAQQSMWTIRAAFESLDIPVTVIGYSDKATMVAMPNTPASRNGYTQLPPSGSTEPDQALGWARAIFRSSQAANRLLISITDGQWMMTDSTTKLMKDIDDSGVQTLMVTIGAGIESDDPEKRAYWSRAIHWDAVPKENGKWYGHSEHVSLKGNEMRRLPDEVGKRIARLARENAGQLTM